MFRSSCKEARPNCHFSIESDDKWEALALGLEHIQARHRYEVTPKVVENLSKAMRTV